MNTKIEVYLGAPIEVESERRFLSTLCADLKARGQDALVLANFLLPLQNPIHQIDFLVILNPLVCHIELKNLTAPIVGDVNGMWDLILPDGTKKPLHANPYRQALSCKYAISDQMHRLAKRDPSFAEPLNGSKFFKHFESSVCVYPQLIEGSKVPSDKLVRLLGYPALLEFLCSTERKPGWSWNDWTTFAMELGLVRQEEMDEAPTGSTRAAEEMVQAYCRRFRDYHAPSTTKLVRTTLQVASQKIDSSERFDLLAQGRHCQLIGTSGSGKSLHAEYMALKSLEAGRVPIFARAIDYAGKLSFLLDRSIAHFCPRTATVFIDAVRQLGKPLTLIIDGYNECPTRLKDRLIQDLQAAFLRWEIPIVITTQEELSLPPTLTGDTLRFCELNENERRAILASYSHEEVPTDIDNLTKPFRSAYELSLAANCLGEIVLSPTRAGLFDAYVRRRCSGLVDPALARRLLSEVADVMRADLLSSLPVDQVWRIGERVIDDQRAPLSTIQDVMSSGIIDVDQGQCTFRHELLQRYFESIALVRTASGLPELAETLKRPVHHALIEFALGMQTEPAGVRACLQSAADARLGSNLFDSCLQRRFGEVARNVVVSDAANMLREAEADLSQLNVDVSQDHSDNPYVSVDIAGAKEWTPYANGLMKAVADSLPFGLFLEEVLHLLGETERYLIERLETIIGPEKVNKRSFQSHLFWELFVFGAASQTLPAAAVLRPLDGSILSNTLPAVIQRIQQRLTQTEELSNSQLYLMLSFLRYNAMPNERGVVHVIQHCWNSGIYHLQLKMLDCVMSWQGLPMSEATRSDIAESLSSLRTSNVMLNTQLVETMMAYDLIEPLVDSEDLKRQLAEIIPRPHDPEAQQAAYAAISNIFEFVFDDTFYQAIENLSTNDRVTLFTMAALALPSYSMSGDYVLSRLLEVNDPNTLPAFERFVRELDAEAFCPQDSDACFVLGHVGCAKFINEPRQLIDLSTDDHRAWQCFGEIIFWSSKPGLSNDEIGAHCKPIWQTLQSVLAFEAVDPLRRIAQALWKGRKPPDDDPVQRLFSLFREEIRLLLEYGIKHREQLSAIDKRLQADLVARELTTFIIHTLGQIGNAESVRVLSPLIDHNYHGQDAVEAIRRLNSGRSAERITVLHRIP